MIVIPMAGRSQRFTKAGYDKPKYMLMAGGQSVFAHVLRSFEFYFQTEKFLFICRDILGTKAFIETEASRLGIKNVQIVILEKPTQGQAETVVLGLQQAGVDAAEPITIFNIDTLRPNFIYPADEFMHSIDGYLEVFKGQGDSWSFARTISPTDLTVVETAEKKRISDLCSTGLYYFARVELFMCAFDLQKTLPASTWQGAELYIAPLYNQLIQANYRIKAVEIASAEIIPCGTPDEYESLRRAQP
jgi:hypothetical protein